MVDAVTERALRLAKDKGWNQSEFAEAIGADKQHITNWKKRGFPPARYARTAEVLGVSVEELITGKKPATQVTSASRIAEPTTRLYGHDVTEEAVMFAKEWEKLTPPLRAQVQALVHVMVAEIVRDSRGSPVKKPAKGSSRSDRANA